MVVQVLPYSINSDQQKGIKQCIAAHQTISQYFLFVSYHGCWLGSHDLWLPQSSHRPLAGLSGGTYPGFELPNLILPESQVDLFTQISRYAPSGDVVGGA